MEFSFSNNQMIAMQNGQMVGNVMLGKQSEHVYRVLRVFVDEAHRGKGIAGVLMEQVVDWARKNAFKLVPVCSYAIAYFEKNKTDVLFTAEK